MIAPNFFVIGAAKSGTSSLCAYLAQHPQVFMPSVKEPHFFSIDEKVRNLAGPDDPRRMRFAVGDPIVYGALFQDAGTFVARGDGSTSYLDSAKAAASIREFASGARIVVLLRNPVDRAYASYLHLRRDGSEPLSDFAEALRIEDQRIRSGYEELWHYRTRQFTHAKLARYFDAFGAAKIRIYLYEEWKADNLSVLTDLFHFLGVDAGFKPESQIVTNTGGTPRIETLHRLATGEGIVKRLARSVVPSRLRRGIRNRVIEANLARPPLSARIREELKRSFRSDILKTQDLIRMDLSRWL